MQRTRNRVQPNLAIAVLLIALSATAPMSIDMFLPSLPSMTEDFGARDATMQLAVTLFLVAFAGSQIVWGQASDRLGRRPMMFAGLGMFIVGGVVALLSSSAEVLIAARVLQGFGGGAGPTLARAMVLDIYGREGAARFIAHMSIVLPLAPAISPIVGGFLHDAFDWHAVFVVLIAVGVLLFAAYAVLLPETRPERLETNRRVRDDYRLLLSSSTFVGYSFVMGLMFAGQLVFISMSSFVLIDQLGLAPQVFGLAFAVVALGLMAGATLSSRLVAKMEPRRIVLLGALVSAASSGTMTALSWAGAEHPATVVAPMFFTAFGLGVTRPSAMAGALVGFPQIAGLASALMGFSQMALSTGYNIVYSQLFAPGVTSLSSGVFVAVLSALVVLLVLRPGRVEALPASEPGLEAQPAG
ncbi:MAG: multidrug effflux MFS transporter [Dehalococcoidia bacterium]